jgi:RimJ/RimL family protein N-acetyltransferase
LAPLTERDLELVLAWRSHPDIYAHFRQQDSPLAWDEHRSWFESRDPDRHDFVISFSGRRVGVVNIDATDEVGILLGDFSAHGNGVATATLEWVCDRFADRTPLFAEIYDENESSKRLFERCGFQQQHSDGEWNHYSYDP